MISDSFWRVLLMGTLFSFNTALYSFSQAMGKARSDLWLSILLAAIPAALCVWFLFGTARRWPDRCLMEALIVRHPFAGRVVSALYMLFFFFMLVRDLRMTNDLINMVLLPFTPATVIMIMVVVTMILIARNPREVVIRITQLGQPLFLCCALLSVFMLVNRFDMSNFLPMFDRGISPSLEGSWYFLAYMGEIVALPFVFEGRELTVARGWISLLITVIGMEVLGFSLIAVLGVHIPAILLYPIFNLVEFIKITDFLDRFELMLVSIYLPGQIVKCSILLFILWRGLTFILSGTGATARRASGTGGAHAALAVQFPEAAGYPLVVPLGALAYTGAFLFFHDTVELFPLNRVWPVLSAPFVLIIPLLMYVFLRPARSARDAS